MPEEDPIAEIREVRHRISEECDHDPQKLVAYYKLLRQQRKERLLLEMRREFAMKPYDERSAS